MGLCLMQTLKLNFSRMRTTSLMILFLAMALNIYGQEKAYKEGEKLRYIMKYELGVVRTEVGEAQTSISKKRDSKYGDYLHAEVTGTTYKFYDILFKVRDYFESKFDPTTERPFYFHRNVNEGRYKMLNYHHYNEDNSINVTIKRKEAPFMDTLLKGDINTFDLLSLFYHSRNIDFSTIPIGVPQPITFAIDKEILKLYYKFLGREEKRIPLLGRFRTMKFSARLVSGEIFSGKDEMIIWVSDDQNKIPLFFETPILVGRVSGRLSSFENLKYPLTSKIK